MSLRSCREGDVVHIAIPKPFKNRRWDIVCMRWLEGRRKPEEIQDEVPTCLFCIGRIAILMASSIWHVNARPNTTSGTRSA